MSTWKIHTSNVFIKFNIFIRENGKNMTTQTRLQYGVSILEPDGKMVGSAVSELQKIIMTEIEAYNKPRILINFKKVHRIDSAGLGMLVDVHIAAMKKSGRIGIIHLGKHIKNVIVFTRVIHLLELFDSEDEAVSALSA